MIVNKPDFIEYIYEEYLKELTKQEAELTPEAEKLFKSFIEFTRAQLKKNPPISQCVLPNGLGIRFADNSEIPILNLPQAPDPFDVSMPITTQPLASPAGPLDSRCIPIFGAGT